MDKITAPQFKNQEFIQFRANCNSTEIKTYWNNLNIEKDYNFVKYNPNSGQKIYNYPATLTKETINGKLIWVSIHQVLDQGNGDFDNLNGKMYDPYTLEEKNIKKIIDTVRTGEFKLNILFVSIYYGFLPIGFGYLLFKNKKIH